MRSVVIVGAVVLLIVACASVTVVVGTNGATVSEEADKGMIIKPHVEKGEKKE